MLYPHLPSLPVCLPGHKPRTPATNTSSLTGSRGHAVLPPPPPLPIPRPRPGRVIECDSAQHLYTKYDDLVAQLADRERAVYEEWQADVTELILSKLQLPLITRADNVVAVNFDPQVGRLAGGGGARVGGWCQFFRLQNRICLD